MGGGERLLNMAYSLELLEYPDSLNLELKLAEDAPRSPIEGIGGRGSRLGGNGGGKKSRLLLRAISLRVGMLE